MSQRQAIRPEEQGVRRRENGVERLRGTGTSSGPNLSPYGPNSSNSSGSTVSSFGPGTSSSSNDSSYGPQHHQFHVPAQTQSQQSSPSGFSNNLLANNNSNFSAPSFMPASSTATGQGSYGRIDSSSRGLFSGQNQYADTGHQGDEIGRSTHDMNASTRSGPSRGGYGNHYHSSVTSPSPSTEMYRHTYLSRTPFRLFPGGGNPRFEDRQTGGNESPISILPGLSTVSQSFNGSEVGRGNGFSSNPGGHPNPQNYHQDQRSGVTGFGGNSTSLQGTERHNASYGDNADEDGEWEDWPEAYESQSRNLIPRSPITVLNSRIQRPLLQRSYTSHHPSHVYSPEISLLERSDSTMPPPPPNTNLSTTAPPRSAREQIDFNEGSTHTSRSLDDPNSGFRLTSPEGPSFEGMMCVICMESATEATITHCGHIFCYSCLMQALLHKEAETANLGGSHPTGTCPTCRKPINRNKKGHVTPLVFKVKKFTKLTKVKVKKGSEEWKEAMRQKAEREKREEEAEKDRLTKQEEAQAKKAKLIRRNAGKAKAKGGVRNVDLTGDVEPDDEWEDAEDEEMDDDEYEDEDGPRVKRRMV